MRLIRFLRGALKTAVTWSLAWTPVSFIPMGLYAVFGGVLPEPRMIIGFAISQAVSGAINGFVFASVVAVMGRRKTFESISMRWIAACGAIGGALFPVVVRSVFLAANDFPLSALGLVSGLALNAAIGAGFAAASLSLARRAPQLRPGETTDTPAIASASR